MYEIDCRRRQHNVYRRDGTRRVTEYCIYAGDWGLPLADNALAQKLLLEHDEPRFLRIANSRALAAA